MATFLREKRLERKETQAQVADAVGTDRSTYAHIELGRTGPSLSLAMSIARYFDSTVEELFGSSISSTPTQEQPHAN
jgi:putative transcriptional regulator